MKNELETTIAEVCQNLFGVQLAVDLTRPDEQFGDYATNVALQLGKRLGRNPREIGEALAEKLSASELLTDVQVAGPGFVNMSLNDEVLWKTVRAAVSTKPKNYQGQTVVLEYSDPNPFKVLHVGHIYTSIIGDAISKLVQVAGGRTHPVNFGGDVGLHVGRTMWAILQELGGEYPEKLTAVPEDGRAEWMGACYVKGTRAYESDPTAKTEIVGINKRVYKLHQENDKESPFAQIYWTCRKWSYDYFDAFYDRIGSHFEKYYPESMTAPLGIQTVKEQLEKGVYEESDGAIVFRGEPYGLHTRVFINSHGLPTYEGKDVGLIFTKWNDYHYDKSIIITGNDIVEYMKVVLKSVEQFAPELVQRTTHLTHGNVKLAGGIKMSSRKGNFLRAVDVLDAVAEANKTATGKDDEQIVLGAIKYAFTKQRIGGDIIFDPKESVSLQGNSGPYLQYAHARARSILRKAPSSGSHGQNLTPNERRLARKIAEYPEIVQESVDTLMPHHIAIYLYELAQVFNSFYEHNRVIGDPRESIRLELVKTYAGTLKDGLELLGIHAPDRL